MYIEERIWKFLPFWYYCYIIQISNYLRLIIEWFWQIIIFLKLEIDLHRNHWKLFKTIPKYDSTLWKFLMIITRIIKLKLKILIELFKMNVIPNEHVRFSTKKKNTYIYADNSNNWKHLTCHKSYNLCFQFNFREYFLHIINSLNVNLIEFVVQNEWN